MNLNAVAIDLLRDRYLIRDEEGNPTEEPIDMFKRVAKAISQAEGDYNNNAGYWEGKFLGAMIELKFMPGSPTLLNAGRKFNLLSSCFVLPIEDSMRGIFKTIWDMALVQRAGGGTGYSWNRLRPKGSIVSSSMGKSSGLISFMRAYNEATETIKQGGMRKGANMAILNVDHPDIEDFITCKRKEGIFTNFNISVAITGKFMKALEEDGDIELGWGNPPKHPYKVWETVKAKYIWDMIVDNAWTTGDPGIWFIDVTNDSHPVYDMPDPYKPAWIESTNPCGEQPLLPYESCNLGSINLAKFVKGGKVDFTGLKYMTGLAVRFLDDVIDCNEYPLKEIEDVTLLNRKIGLGVMGWHDMLQQLKVPYDSQQALEVAEQVMSCINDFAFQTSVDLADERGPFPNIKNSAYDYIRNATRTTIAPTGSISMIAGCNSGIEPYYNNYYMKVVLDNKQFPMKNPTLEAMVPGVNWEEILALSGSVQEAELVPEEFKPLFTTALEIDWQWHLKHQTAFQKHTDNAVSKTINLNASATRKDIDSIYRTAYRSGCKGVTVFRQGSKREQVLNVIKPAKRPRKLPGSTEVIETGCGKIFIHITKLQGDVFEVFVTGPGKGGGCAFSMNEALGRVVSMALRAGVDRKTIVKQLRGIRCPERCAVPELGIVSSCPDALGIALQEASVETVVDKGGNCPDCGEAVIYEEGCSKCTSCHWKRCG